MVDNNDIVKTEDEIDLVEIISKLWSHRKFIIITTTVFTCIGILVALLSKPVYTAGCSIVPQTNEKPMSGGLGGLAAITGINLPSGSGELLSPKIYPRVLSSTLFYKELMETEILFSSYPEPIKILDYFTLEKYNKESVPDLIIKYTVGLPFLIINSIRGSSDGGELLLPDTKAIILTQNEYICKKILSGIISVTLNEKEGSVSLSASMGDPLAAAQMTLRIQELLQKYVTAFKIEKAKSNLEFINTAYEIAKENFEKKQKERADFLDSNRGLSTVRAKIQEETLTSEYNLMYSLYSEHAAKREQAKIQVTEATPVFTVIEPVMVPIEKSAPKRSVICVAFLFLGLISSMGWVFVKPFVTDILSNVKK